MGREWPKPSTLPEEWTDEFGFGDTTELSTEAKQETTESRSHLCILARRRGKTMQN
jgi:hypothetical protein